MKITVLCGGESSEREVSLRSGMSAARAILSLGHEVALLDTLSPVSEKTAFTRDFSELEAAFSESACEESCTPFHPDIIHFCQKGDKVFIALHGGIGEDGRLQAALECYGIPYCGSGYASCAQAMDKSVSKRLYRSYGISTPYGEVFKKGIKRDILFPSYPCIVKPINGGSSIGMQRAADPRELKDAVKRAFELSDALLIEERIFGRELSVSVLNDKALAVTEIIPKSDFFDYQSKYSAEGARELTPAPLPPCITQKALSLAERAHRALGLRNFSRTDMILQKGSARLWVLETNALPGLTENSIFPSALRAMGMKTEEIYSKMLI